MKGLAGKELITGKLELVDFEIMLYVGRLTDGLGGKSRWFTN